MFTQSTHAHLSAQIRPTSSSVPIQGARPPRRRISRRPPATPQKKMRLSRRKNAASRQQERETAAKCPAKGGVTTRCQKISNYRSEFIYDHAVKLRCCIKIGKSQKIILFRTL